VLPFLTCNKERLTRCAFRSISSGDLSHLIKLSITISRSLCASSLAAHGACATSRVKCNYPALDLHWGISACLLTNKACMSVGRFNTDAVAERQGGAGSNNVDLLVSGFGQIHLTVKYI
jgi:hypothetical protein